MNFVASALSLVEGNSNTGFIASLESLNSVTYIKCFGLRLSNKLNTLHVDPGGRPLYSASSYESQ